MGSVFSLRNIKNIRILRILLFVVIVSNLHLCFYLNERKKTSEQMNSKQSYKNIENARKMVLTIVKLQTVYVALWLVLVILMNTLVQHSGKNSGYFYMDEFHPGNEHFDSS